RTTSAAVQSDAGGLPAADLFQDGLIPRLRIELSSEAMASLRSKPRIYVPATVREGTRVYTNVSIRLKGGPGSFRPLEDRPAFTAAVRETDLQQRLAAVNKTLDLDRFISFIAMEVIVCHWDGYALNRNNFRIYHDRAAGKLVFFPQGLDQTFQRQNIPALPP